MSWDPGARASPPASLCRREWGRKRGTRALRAAADYLAGDLRVLRPAWKTRKGQRGRGAQLSLASSPSSSLSESCVSVHVAFSLLTLMPWLTAFPLVLPASASQAFCAGRLQDLRTKCRIPRFGLQDLKLQDLKLEPSRARRLRRCPFVLAVEPHQALASAKGHASRSIRVGNQPTFLMLLHLLRSRHRPLDQDVIRT